MKHKIKGKKLNRHYNHRQSLRRNLIKSLISFGHIITTETKAKWIQADMAKIITKAKKDTLHNRRQLITDIQDKKLVQLVFKKYIPIFTDLSGGFLKSVRLGRRKGDNSMMVKVDFKLPGSQDKSADKQETKS